MLLKFVLRLFIDNEVRRADFLKALTIFPIDVGFLSLSYGTAIIYANPAMVGTTPAMQTLFGVVFISVLLLAGVIFLAKRSERAFVLSRPLQSSLLAALAYSIAIPVTAYSIAIGGLFQ